MQHRMGTRYPVWLLAVFFLILATLACEPPPVTGVNCLEEQDDGSILAIEEYGTYVSRDGGLSWQSSDHLSYLDHCGYAYPSDEPWALTDPSNPDVIYRFAPNISIERSANGGATWRREIDLSGTEARTLYYVRFRNDGYEYRAGPSDALFHSQTGNLVVAMSYEGVLVRTPQGKWGWIGVDKYRRVDMRNPFISIPLIWGELIMGLAFAFLTISTANLMAQKKNFWLVMLGIGIVFVVSFLLAALVFGLSAVADIFLEPLGSVVWWVCWLVVLCLPFIVGYVVGKKTHQREISVFVWAVAGWACLILGGLFAYLDPREGWGIAGSLILIIPLAILGLIISSFIIFKLHQASPRALILTLTIGLSGFLSVAGAFFLWAIGGIAFYSSAVLWAWGLGLLNLFFGAQMLKRFSLSQRTGESVNLSETSS